MSKTVNLPITGACHCGAVRIEVRAAPMMTRLCWCRFCQKLGAGSATVNAFFPVDQVMISGETRSYTRTADSGNEVITAFCPVCGTDISTRAPVRPNVIGIRAGVLDDPSLLNPASTIWTDSAPGWATIASDIPSHGGQAPTAT